MMVEKNKKIVKLKSKQSKLRKKIKRKKKYVPYTLSFLLITTLAILFFYDYMIYNFFGNHFGALAIIISFIGLISVSYLISTHFKVQNLNNEIKNINSKLYLLMRLELEE